MNTKFGNVNAKHYRETKQFDNIVNVNYLFVLIKWDMHAKELVLNKTNYSDTGISFLV